MRAPLPHDRRRADFRKLVHRLSRPPVAPPKPLRNPRQNGETLAQPSTRLAALIDFAQIISWLKRLGPAGVVTVLAGTLPPVMGFVVIAFISKIGDWLRTHGTTGVLTAIVAFTVLGGAMLAPTYSFSALCGWAFGIRVGSFTAMTAIVAAAMVNYVWAKVVCKDRLTRLLDENPKSRAIYHSLLTSSELKTLGVTILLRLPPTSPFALTNVLLAATKVRFMTVFAGTVVGMLPRTLIVVFVLAHMSRLDLSQSKALFIGGLVSMVVVLGILGWLGRRALDHAIATGEVPPDTRPTPTPPSL